MGYPPHGPAIKGQAAYDPLRSVERSAILLRLPYEWLP